MTVFDFSEIMERTEKRVGDEVLGAGPQNVDELRVIARRVKSKYLLRIQLKEKHSVTNSNNSGPVSPLSRQIGPMPSKESVKSVTSSMIGGVGGIVSLLKRGDRGAPPKESTVVDEEAGPSVDVIEFTSNGKTSGEPIMQLGQEVEINCDGATSIPTDDLFGRHDDKSSVNSFSISSPVNFDATSTINANGVGEIDELEKLSAELGELSVEAFDLLGDDFDSSNLHDIDHTEELLDAMDVKVDSMAAFAIDDDDLLSS